MIAWWATEVDSSTLLRVSYGELDHTSGTRINPQAGPNTCIRCHAATASRVFEGVVVANGDVVCTLASCDACHVQWGTVSPFTCKYRSLKGGGQTIPRAPLHTMLHGPLGASMACCVYSDVQYFAGPTVVLKTVRAWVPNTKL
jgi:hypothetical protein